MKGLAYLAFQLLFPRVHGPTPDDDLDRLPHLDYLGFVRLVDQELRFASSF